jgi:hypothetical protein
MEPAERSSEAPPMSALIGRRLVKVVRLAWHPLGRPARLNAGPALLVFDDGRAVLLDGDCDWTLEVTHTAFDDTRWFERYDYDWDGSRWLSRDASAEPPFASVMARRLSAVEPLYDDVDQLMGVKLDFEHQVLTLRTWQGEIET